MSQSQVTTPILLKIGEVKYKLLYLNFSKDGSVYLIFPSKGGYKIRSHKDISFRIGGKQNVTLEHVIETYKMPKLTFHELNRSIHINCFGQKYVYDKPILNMSATTGAILFPFCQVVIPNNLSYFDIYREKKEYTTPLIFEVVSNFSKSLSIEFWIHNSGFYIYPKDIPLIDKRGNIISVSSFRHHELGKYTCTIVASELEGTNAGIIVAVRNDVKPFIFELVP